MRVFIKYGGVMETGVHSAWATSQRSLRSRLLEDELFSGEEVPPGRRNSLREALEERDTGGEQRLVSH